MRVLVTGSNGMLGKDLCPILKENGYEVIATDIDELDITDELQVAIFLKEKNPDIIINCAAYTNVDKAESEYLTCHSVNTLGTANLAKHCADNCKFVLISTDYVFGNGKLPHTTKDLINPLNIYGITKAIAELQASKHRKHYIIRTSWLYGKHGKNFVETMISLKDKPELKVVNDQTGCPTWTVDLCYAILEIIREKPYGTYHACGGGQTTWYGFAKEIFKQLNLDINLVPCNTDEFPRDAIRPQYSAMNNDGLCRNWKEALSDYLKIRGEE